MNSDRADQIMSPSDVSNLMDDLQEARREAEEYRTKYLRVLADEENYRKRLQKVFDDRVDQQEERILGRLLIVMDNLERALSYGSPDDPLTIGVKLTYDELRGILDDEGAEPIEARGKAFDPELHEAVEIAPGFAANGVDMVDAELSKGFTYKGKVLRPARVRVRKGAR